MTFSIIYIPKIEDEVTLATYEYFKEAKAHMDQIKEKNPRVLPFHYIKENKNEV